MNRLLNKYNIPVPRYTSYPTVPYWDAASWSVASWQSAVKEAFWVNARELSLYVHLPYCENLCTYCGCHKYITKNHGVEGPYIDSLLREWAIYTELFPCKPILKELHLGGGTPTFFDAAQLDRLISGIMKSCEVTEDISISVEGHPANTRKEHLETLHSLGARRLSLGIQDFDQGVQRTINRMQTREEVEHITDVARELGYTSVNYDLIYGLPRQSKETISQTIATVSQLRPDRIAYYSYAHVPWMRPAQKSFEPWLPSQEQKLEMYLLGKDLLGQSGYEEVGMDHFALPDDELFVAHQQGALHRNFMGYTTQATRFSLGLGASSISDTWTAFGQNEKDIRKYTQIVGEGRLPVTRGHVLDVDDRFFRQQILRIMCSGKTSWTPSELDRYGLGINWVLIDELRQDGLVLVDESGLQVTLLGRQFLRNISMAFDARLWRYKGNAIAFSQAI